MLSVSSSFPAFPNCRFSVDSALLASQYALRGRMHQDQGLRPWPLALRPWPLAANLNNPRGALMVRTNFENLRVYRLSESLADEVWKIARSWDYFARDTVGKQLVRAVDSIGANIAEGSGRGSSQDNRRFVKIARGSLYESKHWLRRAYKRDLLTADQTTRLKPLVDELAPMLNAYLRSIRITRTPNIKAKGQG